MAEDDDAVRALADELASARKYAAVSRDVLERTARWALERHPRPRDAGKAARRKLHQVHSAFVTDRGLREAERLAAGLPGESLRETCRGVLRCHASTAEREPFLAEFYAAAFDGAGSPRRVVDLAAGLNPFAIPWMPLGEGTEYVACDLDHRFAALAGALAPHVDVALRAGVADLVAGREPVRADVVLLLKTLTTLEQQVRGAARALLERIDAGRLVVSFPAGSLGGREKGMRESYDRLLGELAEGLWEPVARVPFPTETLHLLARRP